MFSKLFAFSTLLGLLVAMPAMPATATVTEVQVVAGGPDGLIQYNPDSITAEPGTIITFVFKQKNHTVTQSTLETPCSPLAGGYDTGFMPVAENIPPFPTTQFIVNNTEPMWFYCRQTGHCQKGMVFAVNPGDNLVQFQDNARNTPPSSLETPPSSSSVAPPSSSAVTTSSQPHWTAGSRAPRAARFGREGA